VGLRQWVALANPGKAVILLGSDGSQMEGDNAEAARLTVGKHSTSRCWSTTITSPLPASAGIHERVRLTRTLSGYGLITETTMGEDLDALYIDLCRAFRDPTPLAW